MKLQDRKTECPPERFVSLVASIGLWGEDIKRAETVTRRFPQLSAKLVRLARQIGADRDIVDLALRHPILAAALCECIEDRLAAPKEDDSGARQLLSQFSRNVGQKLKQPEKIRHLSEYEKAIPEISVYAIHLACRQGRIPWLSAAIFLQSKQAYLTLLGRSHSDEPTSFGCLTFSGMRTKP